MSKMLAHIIATGYSELAYELFDFVKHRGQLPDEETILQIFKGSTDFDEIGNKLNYVFLECTREALLNAVSQENREKVRTILLVQQNLQDDSTQDHFVIRFLDRTLDYIDTAVLDDLYYSLKRYEREFLTNNLALHTTVSLEAPNQLIDSLLEVEEINTFLYQIAVEPIDKRDYETYILHQGLIRQLWMSQQVSFERMSQLHSLIRPYMGNLRNDSVTHPFNAEFIVINVKVN